MNIWQKKISQYTKLFIKYNKNAKFHKTDSFRYNRIKCRFLLKEYDDNTIIKLNENIKRVKESI